MGARVIADNPAFGDSCIDVRGNTLTLTLAIGVMPDTLNVGARRFSLEGTPDRFSYLAYASRLRACHGLPMPPAVADEPPWARRTVSA